MDPREEKLVKKGVAPEVAASLVAAGFDRPSKIRKATDTALKDVLKSAQVTALRKIAPREK